MLIRNLSYTKVTLVEKLILHAIKKIIIISDSIYYAVVEWMYNWFLQKALI